MQSSFLKIPTVWGVHCFCNQMVLEVELLELEMLEMLQVEMVEVKVLGYCGWSVVVRPVG